MVGDSERMEGALMGVMLVGIVSIEASTAKLESPLSSPPIHS
jgi:hypothetical protein